MLKQLKNATNTISATTQSSQGNKMLTDKSKNGAKLKITLQFAETSVCSIDDNRANRTLQGIATFDSERYKVGVI